MYLTAQLIQKHSRVHRTITFANQTISKSCLKIPETPEKLAKGLDKEELLELVTLDKVTKHFPVELHMATQILSCRNESLLP